MHLKIISAKSRPFCFGLNVLNGLWPERWCGLCYQWTPGLQDSTDCYLGNYRRSRHGVFKCVKPWFFFIEMPLKFVPNCAIDNESPLAYAMAWHRNQCGNPHYGNRDINRNVYINLRHVKCHKQVRTKNKIHIDIDKGVYTHHGRLRGLCRTFE